MRWLRKLTYINSSVALISVLGTKLEQLGEIGSQEAQVFFTPSACEADMRADTALRVYLSDIVYSGPLPHQCRRRHRFHVGC